MEAIVKNTVWLNIGFLLFAWGCSGAQDDADTANVYLDQDAATDGAAGQDGVDTSVRRSDSLVVLNEVVATAANGGEDWIELFNPSNAIVDVSGYTVTDDGGGSYLLSAGSVIAPLGYLVLDRATLGFGLGSDDGIQLADAEGAVVDLASWTAGDAPEGMSWGRFPNGTGSFKTLSTPTQGAANIDGDIPPGDMCGDGTCNASETCSDCEADCGPCTSPADSDVVLNEVVAAAADNGPDWVELANTSDMAASLEGWSMEDAGGNLVTFTSSAVVPANGYLLLARGQDFDFGIGGQDMLTLRDASGELVDTTNWLEGEAPTGSSWGRLPDTTGPFQTLTSPTPGEANANGTSTCGDGICDDSEDCATCEADCGACSASAPNIAVNEVVAEAADGGEDWVELANVDLEDHDLSGWSIEDAAGGKYIFPEQTIILSGGYLLFIKGTSFDFGLEAADTVTLFDTAGTVVDSAGWEDGAAPEGSSWARLPDKTGDFQTTAQPTPNASNVSASGPECGDGQCNDAEDCEICETDCGPCLGPASAVINEVVAKGADGGVDWVELHNVGTNQADLSGWALEDAGGGIYVFPTPTNITVGGYLLVTQTELGFGLGKSDSLSLKDASGVTKDLTAWEDGDAPEGSSWARIPNGTGPFVTTDTLTPDAANIAGTGGGGATCGDSVCSQDEDCGTCAEDCGMCAGCPTDLFISEYIEGSGVNKALEIYNGTGAAVDLSSYAVWTVANGGEWPETTTDLSGTLESGSVLVLCSSGFDAEYIGICDQTFGGQPVNFNGDDAVGLARNNGGTTLLIDQVGDSGPDIGDGWAVGGIELATQNHTLVRKAPSIGLTNWSLSAAADWLVYDQDVFQYLGAHTFSSPACQ
jgi:hypothetical protein